MGVRIVHDHPNEVASDRDYVRVQACTDPDDDTVTLVTIQRVTEKVKATEPSESTAKVKTLVQGQRMSPDSAVGFAKRYAERKHIPVVYAEVENSTGM